MMQKITGFAVYGVIFLVAWGLLYAYQRYGYQRVEGQEMMPNVKPDTHSVISVFSGRMEDLRVGDVVMYEFAKPGFERQTRWVGRILAKPGDRVKVVAGELFVNDKPAPREFVSPQAKTSETLEEIVVPRDTVYIVHDNRKYLTLFGTFGFSDSRGVGPIGIHAIVGKL
jgi:signal peptidase I